MAENYCTAREFHLRGDYPLPAFSGAAIVYVLNGQITLHGESELKLRRQSGVVLPVRPQGYLMHGKGASVFCLNVGSGTAGFTELQTYPNRVFFINDSQGDFSMLCRRMLQADSNCLQLALLGNCCFLFDRIFSAFSESTASPDSYLQAIRYIEGHIDRAPTVQDVARHVSLSPSQVYRIFMQHAGCSPQRYINDLRTDKACQLIRDSGLSIGIISSFLGFKYESYFYQWFKKQIGITPSEYRMLIRSDTAG